MSRTEIYVARSHGCFYMEGEFSNSWRGAMWIWNKLWNEYHKKTHEYDEVIIGDNLSKLFKEYRPLITPTEEVVLLSTADYIAVAGKDLDALADAFDAFVVLHGDGSSLTEQAEFIRGLDDDVEAIAWNQTTVCEFWNGGDPEIGDPDIIWLDVPKVDA